MRERTERLDEHCAALGRDPATLRRSYRMPDTRARTGGGLISYHEVGDLLVEMLERIAALGFTEIGLYYPTIESQLPHFERAARKTILRLKRWHAARCTPGDLTATFHA